jgi:AcrR family transcriptional regulator
MLLGMDSDGAAKKTRKDVLRDFRQAQIVDAARAVIGDLGYTEASVDLIAERAGMSKSTLYTYFESKEEILAACFATGQSELFARIDAALRHAKGVSARLEALVAATFEHFDADRVFFGAVMSQAYLEPAERAIGTQALEALSKAYGQRLLAVIEEGHATGELGGHAAEESALLVGTMIYGALGLRAREALPIGPAAVDAGLLCRRALEGLLARR